MHACRVFRNGDERSRGARVLLPRRILGSWEHVLQLITDTAGLVTPVKRLCTLGGKTVHSVAEIQQGGKYVALEGGKCFQKVSYLASDESGMLSRSVTYLLCCMWSISLSIFNS